MNNASERISIACPQCGKKFLVPSTTIGKRAKCPGCQQVFTVEAAEDEVELELVPLDRPLDPFGATVPHDRFAGPMLTSTASLAASQAPMPNAYRAAAPNRSLAPHEKMGLTYVQWVLYGIGAVTANVMMAAAWVRTLNAPPNSPPFLGFLFMIIFGFGGLVAGVRMIKIGLEYFQARRFPLTKTSDLKGPIAQILAVPFAVAGGFVFLFGIAMLLIFFLMFAIFPKPLGSAF